VVVASIRRKSPQKNASQTIMLPSSVRKKTIEDSLSPVAAHRFTRKCAAAVTVASVSDSDRAGTDDRREEVVIIGARGVANARATLDAASAPANLTFRSETMPIMAVDATNSHPFLSVQPRF
jgi:hypothetical protein